MKQEFLNAVADRNLAKVRMSLTNELLLDPRGKFFSEMLSYAMTNLPNLFDENREAEYTVPPQENWDKEFMLKVKNDLDSNFSKEKLAFYEAVVKAVGRNKAIDIEKEEQRKREQRRTGSTEQGHTQQYHINKAYATVSAGGATLALVGLVAGKTLLTVVGGAVLIVGGVII